MKKRLLAMLLAAMMLVSLLSGCGGTSSEAASAGKSTAASASEPEVQSEAAPTNDDAVTSAAVSAAESTEETEALAPGSYPVTLPISDDRIELDWYTGDIGYLWSMMDDISENITLQELEKRTNVHINWTFADFDGSQCALMIASGDWCDVIDNANQQYPGGIQAGVNDGVFLHLTDAINDYMPNYKAYLDEDEVLLRNCTDLDGNINFISKIYKDNAPVMWGPMIRADWAEELGYDVSDITTYDDWHNVMMDMKQEYNMGNGVLRLLNSGVNIYGGMTYGYGVNGQLWVSDNEYPLYAQERTVKMATVENGFRDYLKMMHQWYEDGLITTDFLSISDRNMFDAGEATGDYGIFYGNVNHIPNLYGQAEDENFAIAPLTEPTINKGDQVMFSGSTYSRFSDNSLAILADTEYLEEICRFTDYLFSDEGATLMNYGIEGTSYDVVDGEIVLNKDWFDDCPNMPRAGNYNDVRTGMLGAGIYTCLLDYFGFYNNYYTEVQKETQTVWVSNAPATLAESWEMPTYVTNYISVDDNTTANTHLTDIGTYISEMIPAFILGQKDIDAEWDAFVEKQYNMGLQTVLDIYQAGYDAYWA